MFQPFRFFHSPRRLATRRPNHRRLYVEPLEDRRLLAVFTVNTTEEMFGIDSAVWPLLRAISAANRSPGHDEVVFDFSDDGPTSILIRGFSFHISDPLTIRNEGPEPVILDGQNRTQIFSIGAPTVLQGLTLIRGQAEEGGAIRSTQPLTIESSTIASNSAKRGGAIWSSHDLSISNSTISANSADETGGAILGSNIDITASTISGNSARRTGGGVSGDRVNVASSSIMWNSTLYSAGGGIEADEVTVTSSTVSRNRARSGAGISGGDIRITSSTVSDNIASTNGGGVQGTNVTVDYGTIVRNWADNGGGIGTSNGQITINHSIVAKNFGSDVLPRRTRMVVEHSLIGDNSATPLEEAPIGKPDVNGNLVGGPVGGAIDPRLGRLTDYGGITPTYALLADSPAVDAGDPGAVAGDANVPQFDQRDTSYSRVMGGRIDIGAFEFQPDGDANHASVRASQAVNRFASDLYQHLQTASGNLVFSPLSIATSLAMTYAGAAGTTAAEMESVLYLEPDIHPSFSTLLSDLYSPIADSAFELDAANAIWPRVGGPISDEFIHTIETEYQGAVQSLDYSQPEQAREVINTWVADNTRGRIQNLLERLSANTAMVLTNSVYFKAFWATPFDPENTHMRDFHREGGDTVPVLMMTTQESLYTELMGFQLLELPFVDNSVSMVFMLPIEEHDSNQVTGELLGAVHDWLDTPRDGGCTDVSLPKFQVNVSTQLEQLLPDMGMPSAFSSGGADFSSMTEDPVFIDQVTHQAFLAVNEQGTEAAAATAVSLLICFAKGTPVLTPDGSKPIEELKAGDYVLSRSERNIEGPIEQKLVEEVFQGQAQTLQIHAGGQIIRTTELHPFFVKGQGWTPARELKPGNLLASDQDDWVEVAEVSELKGVEPVYNLRVADLHTYFVGNASWERAVWTHNCCSTVRFDADHPFHFLIRDNLSSTILFMGRIDDPTQADNQLMPSIAKTDADFDGDLDIDGGDFLFWQAGFGLQAGATPENGDADRDGDVDQHDYEYWQSDFGTNRTVQARKAIKQDSLNSPLQTARQAAIDKLLAMRGTQNPTKLHDAVLTDGVLSALAKRRVLSMR